MKLLRRSRIGGAAFCLNCRGKKSNWGKLRGKTHCGEVQSQLFLAELEIIERKKTGNSTFPVFFFGSGRRIRTLTYGVRVRCATFTQSRYVLTNKNYYTGFGTFVNTFSRSAGEKIAHGPPEGGEGHARRGRRFTWPAPDRRRSGTCPAACRRWRRSPA